MLTLWVIRYRTGTGKVWESERCAPTAREALRRFKIDAAKMIGAFEVPGVGGADGIWWLQVLS